MRSVGLVLMLCGGASVDALAQTPPLLFTVAAPETTASENNALVSVGVEDRGLAMWAGSASDFGAVVTLSSPHWTMRSIASLTTVPFDGRGRPTFQQIEIVRPMFAAGSVSIAGGGGVREEWDGTRVLLGRVLAGARVARGRLQASVVLERTVASEVRRDAADVVTSLGWSRSIAGRISVGVEGIGQDLEGFWDPAEADGGAKVLVGPSLYLQSKRGAWSVSLTAGPVLHAASAASDPASTTDYDRGRHFGMFASATWIPSLGQ